MESQSLHSRPVSRRGEHFATMNTAHSYSRPGTSIRSLSSARPTTARPPSALTGGTATRLTSAMTSGPTASNQRIGTAIGFANNRMTERVLTQHGLSGLPSSQARIGTVAGMRQIKDIRYWQSQLQLKMDEIRKETERLLNDKANMDREKSAKKSFERKVREATRELTGLQGKLSDMNIALDSANSNISRQQMVEEAQTLREHNESLQQQLESTFRERQAKEASNAELERSIELERNKINKTIESMDQSDQEKFHRLDELAQRLNADNNRMHEEINIMNNKKCNLETITKSSPDRSEAVRMLLKANELERKLMTAADEEKNRLTPAQEREKLISEVRENKQALSGIQHQIKLAEDSLAEKRELLQQIDDDIDEGNSDRYTKYKELKHRDEAMTKFMDAFKESLAAETTKIELIKNQITSAIEQITMHGINLKTLGLSKSVLDDNNDLTSEDGMLKEYKRLSIQLKQLQILKKRTADQVQGLSQEAVQLTDDIDKFGNLNAVRSESATKYDDLSSRLTELKNKKRVTSDVVREAERRNDQIKDQLKSNESYRHISHLEERLTDLIEDTKGATITLDQLHKEVNNDDVVEDASDKLTQLLGLLHS